MNNTHTHKEFKSGFVAIIGRPNVGKSTLTNELLGQKVVITSHKAQTTRHQIQVIDSTDEYQMVLLDTPGMHIGNASPLNSYMNKSASSSLADADVVLWLLEAGIWTKEDTRVLEHLQNISVPVIICINKVDKITDKEKLLHYLTDVSKKYPADELFPMSSFDNKDIKKLRTLVVQKLPQGEYIFDPEYITTRNDKFIVSEFIREKLMRNLGDELPYDLTVVIDKFEKVGKTIHIYATILVDKKSHKTIIIGNNGAMIKKISTESRKSIEGFLLEKVFLKTWVKVAGGWASDKNSLKSLGYD
jgi:GTP-binding protein Era